LFLQRPPFAVIEGVYIALDVRLTGSDDPVTDSDREVGAAESSGRVGADCREPLEWIG
jgi:hypothetical protein